MGNPKPIGAPSLPPIVIPGTKWHDSLARTSPVFYLRQAELGVDARAKLIDGDFMMLAGSYVVPYWRGVGGTEGTMETYDRKQARQEELGASGVIAVEADIGRLTRDVITSPSTAADIATGRSSNGLLLWISPEGVTFGEWWEGRNVESDTAADATSPGQRAELLNAANTGARQDDGEPETLSMHADIAEIKALLQPANERELHPAGGTAMNPAGATAMKRLSWHEGETGFYPKLGGGRLCKTGWAMTEFGRYERLFLPGLGYMAILTPPVGYAMVLCPPDPNPGPAYGACTNDYQSRQMARW